MFACAICVWTSDIPVKVSCEKVMSVALPMTNPLMVRPTRRSPLDATSSRPIDADDPVAGLDDDRCRLVNVADRDVAVVAVGYADDRPWRCSGDHRR